MTPTEHEIAELEAARRWPDVVRLLEQRASAPELGPADRRDVLLRAMRIYRDRFANHALAIAAAERVLDIDTRHADAIEYLRDIYLKRRDTAKLAALEARLKR